MVLPRIPNYTIRTVYIPKNLFLVIRAKKRKNASESPVVRASLLTDNWCLWYAVFPLYIFFKEMLQKSP